jgi:hypothetical protein
MSWQQLSAILEEARLDAEEEVAHPPVACPNDGTVLQQGRDGELRCPFDGWSWIG